MKYNKKSIASILRSPKTVFTFKDVSLIWGDTNKKNVIASANYYVRTGQLIRVRKGIYSKNENYDRMELANRIFVPSYISFETVLGKEGVNFQYYGQIFIASYLTRNIIINNQTYSFRKIKNEILVNPLGINNENDISTATKERAFLDTIYINGDYYFDHIDSLDWKKIFEILPIYNKKQMAKKVKYWYNYFKENR